jgi:type VI protein secretion system component VasK
MPTEREASLGRILYWTATIIAGLIAAVGVAGYVSNAGEGVPFISTAALTLAGAIWLVGWVCRNLSPDSN